MRKYLVALTALSLVGGVAWADTHGSHQPIKDSYITTKVKAELAADHATSSRDIHVETVDGVVTLSGVVRSDAEKDRAEQDAMRIKGVAKIHNDLKVPD